MKMDLRKVKVGDEVYSCLKDWGEVQKLFKDRFIVNFNHNHKLSYYYTGKYYSTDINPEITDWTPKKREEWKPQLHLVKSHGMKTIRACKTLSAYVAEFAPEWEADWGDLTQLKWSVSYNHEINKWKIDWESIIENKGKVYMPEETAKQLCEDLNSGIVKL